MANVYRVQLAVEQQFIIKADGEESAIGIAKTLWIMEDNPFLQSVWVLVNYDGGVHNE